MGILFLWPWRPSDIFLLKRNGIILFHVKFFFLNPSELWKQFFKKNYNFYFTMTMERIYIFMNFNFEKMHGEGWLTVSSGESFGPRASLWCTVWWPSWTVYSFTRDEWSALPNYLQCIHVFPKLLSFERRVRLERGGWQTKTVCKKREKRHRTPHPQFPLLPCSRLFRYFVRGVLFHIVV